jgi:hypothetical protein
MAPINFGFGRTSRIGSKKKLSSTEPFLPDDLSSIKAWYDASDDTTIVSSGGLVSQWNDKSGNDHHLTQSIESDRPSTNTHHINSKNVLYFNNDMLWTTDSILSGNPDLMMISVVRFLGYNSNLDFLYALGAGQGSTAGLSAGSVETFAWRFNNGNEKYAIGVPATNTNYLISAVRPNGGIYADSTAFFDGTETASTSSGNANSTLNLGAGFSVGAGPSSGSIGSKEWPMNGLIAEIIIIEASDEITRQKVEGYLAHKWNVSHNLPANHPYALGAPAQDGSVILAPRLLLDLDANNTNSYPGTGTTWFDLSGRENNGTLVNSPTHSTNDGGYFKFDDVDDHVDLSISVTDSFTFETWLYHTPNGTGNNYGYLFSGDNGLAIMEGAPGTAGGVPLNTGDLYYYNGAGATNIITNVNANLTPYTWHHLVACFDFDQLELSIYIDNSFVSTVSVENMPSSIDFISKYVAGAFVGNYFDGNISTIKIYDKLLTASQVTTAYNLQKDRFETIPVLYLDSGNVSSYSGSGTTWTDLSSAGNDATLNSIDFSTDNGGVMVLNATSDYAPITLNTALSTTAYTKCVWVNFDSFSNYNNLLSGGASAQHALWTFNTPYLKAGHNGTWNVVTSSTALSTNTWYFAVVTFSTVNGFKIYINGILDASNSSYTTTFTTSGSQVLQIGRYDAGTNGLLGKIGLVSAYNKELNSDEILELYNNTKSRFEPIKVLHLDASDSNSYPGTGTTWFDLSSSANNGTLLNGVTYSTDNSGVLSLNGTNQSVLGNSNVSQIVGNPNVSMGAWIYMNSIPTDYVGVINIDTPLQTFKCLSITVLGGKPAIDFCNTRVRATSALSTGTWYHVVVTKAAGDISSNSKVYVNGVQVAATLEGNNGTPSITAGKWVVGRLNNTPSRYFNGKVGEVFISTETFSPGYVLNLFNSTKQRFGY